MEIKVLQNSDNISLLQISGEMDLYSSNQLKDLIMKMIEKKFEKFILDLNAVERINSSGIGALIFVASTIKKMNLRMTIININEPVQKAIEVTKLSVYFPTVPSLKEAVALLKK